MSTVGSTSTSRMIPLTTGFGGALSSSKRSSKPMTVGRRASSRSRVATRKPNKNTQHRIEGMRQCKLSQICALFNQVVSVLGIACELDGVCR
jgi:hypothetical protein